MGALLWLYSELHVWLFKCHPELDWKGYRQQVESLAILFLWTHSLKCSQDGKSTIKQRISPVNVQQHKSGKLHELKQSLWGNLEELVRHEDGVLGLSLPRRVEDEEQPEPEEDVDGELGLHDAQVGRPDQGRHQRRRQVPQTVGLFREVVQL